MRRVIVDRAVQDAADSLVAIKKVVFEDKRATMEQLLDALKKNFEGYDGLAALKPEDIALCSLKTAVTAVWR